MRDVPTLLDRLRRDEARIVRALHAEDEGPSRLEGCEVLEVGPGQLPIRAWCLGTKNTVTVLDQKVAPQRLDAGAYLRQLRVNGPVRLLKTLGRKLLGADHRRRQAWRSALGVDSLPQPRWLRGDVCRDSLPREAYDVVVSWSALEHVAEPGQALQSLRSTLRPGGVLYVGVHLYTSRSGHHDLRAFTGAGLALPPWAHLRSGTKHLVRPSAYLNQLRLADWRTQFAAHMPGGDEFLERYGEARERTRMTPDLRRELRAYSDEELYTVDAFYLWKKPGQSLQ